MIEPSRVREEGLLQEFKADLHIHTCLSPCGDWEMTPRRIIQQSVAAGLGLIAICDHNTCENAAMAMQEGRRRGLAVLPGMEVCSREEVHLLALFGDMEHVRDLQSIVYAHLTGENRPDVFGYQIIADETDHVLGENPRLLIGATGLSLEQIVSHTHARRGLALCSHVDRPANSILSQLGLIPPDLEVDGVEVSPRTPLATARQVLPAIGLRPCVTSSDAHALADIGRAHTVLRMAAPTLEELALALRGEFRREIVV